ncbi:hypothetical protein SAMN05216308_11134 [Nitrosospira sp. Nsp13]|nr:hypothetical protein SAMN05216308_11134 [Nitrosospira sp. Nsp13]
MPGSTINFLAVNLSKIESIVQELPRISSRRELKEKADEILRLTETVRRLAYAVDTKKQQTSTRQTLVRCLGELGATSLTRPRRLKISDA